MYKLSRYSQTGFSMIEVMVSVFILAVGLLGLMNLQMTSLKNNHSAEHRSTAVILAYDILDSMRLNRDADYRLLMSAIPNGSSRKDLDLIAWRADIANSLPSGLG
jgi:type IV pilus assembly protein PilV